MRAIRGESVGVLSSPGDGRRFAFHRLHSHAHIQLMRAIDICWYRIASARHLFLLDFSLLKRICSHSCSQVKYSFLNKVTLSSIFWRSSAVLAITAGGGLRFRLLRFGGEPASL